jgi:hypothetical protein
MKAIDAEIGEDKEDNDFAKKFNMARCTEICETALEDLKVDKEGYSKAMIAHLCSQNKYQCNNAQAKMIQEVLLLKHPIE